MALGFGKESAGWILFSWGLGSFFGSWLGGRLCHHLGNYRVQILSLGLGGAGFLIIGFLTGYLELIIGIFILSLINDAFRPACMTAAVAASPLELRTRSLALLRLSVNLGMALGPAVGGILAAINYIWLFVADGLTCLAAALFLVTMFPSNRSPDREQRERTDENTVAPWRDIPFILFLSVMFCLAVVFFQFFVTMPLYFHDVYHLPEQTIGILIAVNAMIIVLIEMVLVRRVENCSHWNLLAAGVIAVGLGLFLLAWGTTALWAAFCITVVTIGEMLIFPFSNTLAASRTGRFSSGRHMGAYTASFSLALMVAPAMGLYVYANLGGEFVWYGAGLICLVLTMLCLLLKKYYLEVK